MIKKRHSFRDIFICSCYMGLHIYKRMATARCTQQLHEVTKMPLNKNYKKEKFEWYSAFVPFLLHACADSFLPPTSSFVFFFLPG